MVVGLPESKYKGYCREAVRAEYDDSPEYDPEAFFSANVTECHNLCKDQPSCVAFAFSMDPSPKIGGFNCYLYPGGRYIGGKDNSYTMCYIMPYIGIFRRLS